MQKSQRNTSKQNKTDSKRIKHHEQEGFIPGIQRRLNIKKSNQCNHHINLTEEKNILSSRFNA